MQTESKTKKDITQMSIIQQCDAPTYPTTANPAESMACFATNELKPEETRCSTTTNRLNALTNRLLDQLAFANREAVRSTPLNRTNLFPATLKPVNPGTTIPTESKPRGKLIRSQLAKSLTQALANLS
jgi:hypothetical protein